MFASMFRPSSVSFDLIGSSVIAKTSLINGVRPKYVIHTDRVDLMSKETFQSEIQSCDTMTPQTKSRMIEMFDEMKNTTIPIESYEQISILDGANDPRNEFEDCYALEIKQNAFVKPTSGNITTLLLSTSSLDLKKHLNK